MAEFLSSSLSFLEQSYLMLVRGPSISRNAVLFWVPIFQDRFSFFRKADWIFFKVPKLREDFFKRNDFSEISIKSDIFEMY